MCDVYSPGYASSSSPKKETVSLRRINKPLMEKRRRARINNCLSQLKSLVLDAMKRDSAQFSKLEKADILEMTVRYLKNIQNQQATLPTATDHNVTAKYQAGFTECAGEVVRYLSYVEGMDTSLKNQMEVHLSRCVNTMRDQSPPANVPVQQFAVQSVQPLAIQIPVAVTPVESQHIPGDNLLVAGSVPQSVQFSQLPIQVPQPFNTAVLDRARGQIQLPISRPRTLRESNKGNVALQSNVSVKSTNNMCVSSRNLSTSPSENDLPFPFAKPISRQIQSDIYSKPIVAKDEMIWRPW